MSEAHPRHFAPRLLALKLAALGAVLSCCLSSAALAVPLQPAAIAGTVSFNFLDPAPIDVRTIGLHTLSGPSGDLLLESGLNASPFIFASGSVISNFFGRSVALLRYEMEVVGADGKVPVNVSASGQVNGISTVTDDLFAGFAMRALWWLEDTSGQEIFSDGIETGAQKGTYSDSFNRTVGLDLFANRAYRVNILADIGVRGGSASAYIDPIFSFATGSASGYSFAFSDGVGNGVAPNPDPNPVPVPEPSTLALLAACLLPMGLLWKRRRNSRAI